GGLRWGVTTSSRVLSAKPPPMGPPPPPAPRRPAGRARRRVRGAAPAPAADLATQREVVDAYLAASREGDFDALVAVLDPDVVLRADRGAVPGGALIEIRGAAAVAERAFTYSRLALVAQRALANGA